MWWRWRRHHAVVIAGAYVEWGGSPLALAANTPTCALEAMQLRARFSELWPVAGGGRPEPEPDPAAHDERSDRLFEAAAGRLGLSRREVMATALAWFDVDHRVNLMITVMAHREFRDGAELLPQIGDAAALGDSILRAHWLVGLAQILDDEPVVVIDHATGRGFRLTVSGVGDNFQLHTLLADRLIGDPAHGLLVGDRPAPEWVAAATTGPNQRPMDDPSLRRFRLFDATGGYISPRSRRRALRPSARAAVDSSTRSTPCGLSWLSHKVSHGRRLTSAAVLRCFRCCTATLSLICSRST